MLHCHHIAVVQSRCTVVQVSLVPGLTNISVLCCGLCAGVPQGPHILLTTYNLVQQLPQQTLGHYNVVICDEAHKLKNPTTKQ
jgi:hypothetical protein